MTIHDLDTPALTIDLDILEKNIRETQEACDKFDIPLHQGMTTNLHDEVYAVQNGNVEHIWKVAGRGKVR